MASVNKVILIGNCGRDPEVRYMGSGVAVTNISLATSSKRKDRATGETIEETQWHRVVFYDRLAEVVGEYVKKGAPLYIEGAIKYGKYTDQGGVEKNTVDIVAHEMKMLGGRSQEGQAPAPRQAPPAARGPAPSPQQPSRAPAPRPASGFDDMDDDIPF